MTSRSLTLLGGLLLATLAGCASEPRDNTGGAVIPPRGFFFTSFRAPLTTNVNGNLTGPSSVHMAQERSVHYFRDFLFTGLSFAWDDATIARIARESNISKVSYADYEFMQILGIFSITTIRVYGT